MFSKIFDRASDFASRLKRDQQGVVLVQVGMTLLVLVGMLGIGVDMGRAFLYRAQLSSALDAAALAGSKAFHSDTRDAEIQAFFDSNFDANFMGGQITPLLITQGNAAQRTLSITTSGTVDTTFMRLFGYNDLNVGAAAETTAKQSGLQLVMVLDNTGSMETSDGGTVRMDALKASSKTMVNNLFGSESENDKIQVAVVPYVTTVNVGHLLDSSYVDTSSMPASYTYHATDLDKWNGCVEARGTETDLSLSTAYDVKVDHVGEDWVPFLWRPGYDNNLYSLTDLKGPNGEDWEGPDYQRAGGAGENSSDAGPNINCPAPVLDFTTVKADLTTYIDSLYFSYGRGGTIANLGMIWGWRMLHTGSPFFNDVAYDDDTMVKAAILMTDGLNHVISAKNSNNRDPYWDRSYYHYNGENSSTDNNYDNYDDDGDGKCPGPYCSIREWDENDEVDGPDAWDAVNGSNVDRRYTGDYSGYGRRDEGRLDGATGQTSTRAAINKRLANVCSAMKGMGITIYTITFGDGVDGTSSSEIALRNLYEGCATDTGKYFHAPASTELDGAFEEIANDLTDLRLSK